MVTKEEWDAIDKKLQGWLDWRERPADPTCGDCRQRIRPGQLRERIGDTYYHAGTCGPCADEQSEGK